MRKRYIIAISVLCLALAGCGASKDSSADVYRGLSWSSSKNQVEKTVPGGVWNNHKTDTQDFDIYQVLNITDSEINGASHAENYTFYDKDNILDGIDLVYAMLDDENVDLIYSYWVDKITTDYGKSSSTASSDTIGFTSVSWDAGETYVIVSKTCTDVIKRVAISFESKSYKEAMSEITERQLAE